MELIDILTAPFGDHTLSTFHLSQATLLHLEVPPRRHHGLILIKVVLMMPLLARLSLKLSFFGSCYFYISARAVPGDLTVLYKGNLSKLTNKRIY